MTSTREKLCRDLTRLRREAVQLIDKLTLTQADIMLVKARLMRLNRGKLGSLHG